jgi:hypothetical protein
MTMRRLSAVRGNKKAARWGRLFVKALCTSACNEAALAAEVGGAKRDRTADLLHAMQALSQLSYGPNL